MLCFPPVPAHLTSPSFHSFIQLCQYHSNFHDKFLSGMLQIKTLLWHSAQSRRTSTATWLKQGQWWFLNLLNLFWFNRPYTPTSPLPPELLPSQTPPPLSFFGHSWKKILQIYLLSCANFYPEIKSLIFFQLCSWSSPPFSFNFSSPSSATTPPLKPSWTRCQKSDESLPACREHTLPCIQ